MHSSAAHSSCCSVGLVNVCRYTCSAGCCSLNWASARSLPGPPAKPSTVAAPAAAPAAAPEAAPAAPAAEPEAAPAAAPTAAANAPAPDGPLDPSVVKRSLERALSHVRRTRQSFSLAAACQHEMGLGPRGRDTVSRFLRDETMPVSTALAAMATWARAQGVPNAQTAAPGLKPLDYWLNVQVHAGQMLCGVQAPRLRDWAALLRLGELNEHALFVARHGLASVIAAMDHEDTEHAVEMCILAADLSVERRPGCTSQSPRGTRPLAPPRAPRLPPTARRPASSCCY